MSIKKYWWLVPVALVLMQFIRIDKTNPPVDAAQDYMTVAQPPENIQLMLKAACYDCHSNESIYPWYTNVAPLSWWIKKHINGGREHLNFSEFGTYDAKKATHKNEECAEIIEKKWMPLAPYVWMHPEAKLSDAQRDELIAWFKK